LRLKIGFAVAFPRTFVLGQERALAPGSGLENAISTKIMLLNFFDFAYVTYPGIFMFLNPGLQFSQ